MTDKEYTVAIRNNSTGEIRTYKTGLEWDDNAEWLWTEGNFGCDCNRSLFFDRALGQEEDWSLSCSEHKFAVLHADLPDGTRVLIDDTTAEGE